MTELIWDMTTSGFGPGTMIETTEGPVPIEWLSSTHQVLTRDNGAQPILNIDIHMLRPLDGAFVPLVTILPDAQLGLAPTHPLILPPHHKVLLDGPELSLHFDLEVSFCRCSHLIDGDHIKPLNTGEPMTFYSVLTPAHEVVKVNGIWAETLAAEPGSPLIDLETLSPDLFARLKLKNGAHELAHPCLEDWEGRLLARKTANRRALSFRAAA